MKKRYLGIICFLYIIIIFYSTFSGSLRNFLAPNMQVYIKLSVIPLLFMGLVILFNNKIKYTFKVSDLLLIIPIIMIIIAGDGRLSLDLASNRLTKFSTENKKSSQTVEEQEEIIEPIEEEYDFTNPFFNIKDSSYNLLSNYITFEEDALKYIGKTIKVRGFVITSSEFVQGNYFAFGKYTITCCAADAEFSGFYIDKNENLSANKWYEIEGILQKGKDGYGNTILYIKVINHRVIDSSKEEQYVYPCYSYEGSACDIMKLY